MTKPSLKRGFNGTAGLSGGPASLQAGFFKLFPLFAEGGGIILWIDVLGFSFHICGWNSSAQISCMEDSLISFFGIRLGQILKKKHGYTGYIIIYIYIYMDICICHGQNMA
jgi:hypothetical protein